LRRWVSDLRLRGYGLFDVQFKCDGIANWILLTNFKEGNDNKRRPP
jgi:hypothetical protein